MSLLGATILQTLPLGVVFAILYLAFIRPQQRRAHKHKRMLRELRPGDQVLTEGGLYARVAELPDDKDVLLEFSPNLRLKASKLAISEVVDKSPPEQATRSAPALAAAVVGHP
jgi:preprotein translocase subunit YajC